MLEYCSFSCWEEFHAHRTRAAVSRLDLDIDLRRIGHGGARVDRVVFLHSERLGRIGVLDADTAKQEAQRIGLLADALQVRCENLFEGRPLSDLEKHCNSWAHGKIRVTLRSSLMARTLQSDMKRQYPLAALLRRDHDLEMLIVLLGVLDGGTQSFRHCVRESENAKIQWI
jgi:hypothetical protein